MLTEGQINKIHEALKKGYDVEIQNRKNGIVVLIVKKEQIK